MVEIPGMGTGGGEERKVSSGVAGGMAGEVRRRRKETEIMMRVWWISRNWRPGPTLLWSLLFSFYSTNTMSPMGGLVFGNKTKVCANINIIFSENNKSYVSAVFFFIKFISKMLTSLSCLLVCCLMSLNVVTECCHWMLSLNVITECCQWHPWSKHHQLVSPVWKPSVDQHPLPSPPLPGSVYFSERLSFLRGRGDSGKSLRWG